jgi:hypothetical protein
MASTHAFRHVAPALALGLGLLLAPAPSIAQAITTTVTSITPATTGPSLAPTETFTVVFSAPVSGVDILDFILTTASGNASGTASTLNQVSAAKYTVLVTNISGEGLLRLDLRSLSVVDSNNDYVPPYNSGTSRIVGAPAAAIPTLTEWVMILFAVGLGGLAAFHIQRRRRTASA